MWQKKLVDVLEIAAILSAAGFAALGLLTEFKKRGKITKYGRIAVIGIVLSALTSLGTRWGKEEIERQNDVKKAADERTKQNEELGRYRRQMDRFIALSGQQNESLKISRDLNARMGQSLASQNAVLAGNELLGTKLSMSIAEQRKLMLASEQARSAIEVTRAGVETGTSRTLDAMWINSNRIGPANIQMIFAYTCKASSGEVPTLIESGAFAQIGLRSAHSVDDDDFRPFIEFYPALEPGSVNLTAFKRESNSRRISFFGKNDAMRISTFELFLAGENDSDHVFYDPESWRGAAIDVLISSQLEVSKSELERRLPPWGGKESLLQRYSLKQSEMDDPKLQISVLPCETNLRVTANGRTVLNQNPKIWIISGWPDYRNPTLLVRSYPTKISKDAFPVRP